MNGISIERCKISARGLIHRAGLEAVSCVACAQIKTAGKRTATKKGVLLLCRTASEVHTRGCGSKVRKACRVLSYIATKLAFLAIGAAVQRDRVVAAVVYAFGCRLCIYEGTRGATSCSGLEDVGASCAFVVAKTVRTTKSVAQNTQKYAHEFHRLFGRPS